MSQNLYAKVDDEENCQWAYSVTNVDGKCNILSEKQQEDGLKFLAQ